MARINTTKSQFSGSKTEFSLLPTDVYRMEIKRATLEPNQFAEPLDDGTYPDQLVLCWECYEATEEQDEGVVGLSVWQRMAPWYGAGKRGPSQFKILIDSLIEQEMLPAETDPDDFETDDLVGVKQRVSVETYIKTMGKNQGTEGNRIASILPLKAAKKVVRKSAPQPTKKNVPVPVGADDDEELPF